MKVSRILEKRVKQQLLSRGFTKEQLLNNRNLIAATIDETAMMVVKFLTTTKQKKMNYSIYKLKKAFYKTIFKIGFLKFIIERIPTIK